jgi:hypothetical protein
MEKFTLAAFVMLSMKALAPLFYIIAKSAIENHQERKIGNDSSRSALQN